MLDVAFATRHIHIKFLLERSGKSTPAGKAVGLKQIVRFVEKVTIQALSAVVQGGFWRRRGVQPTVMDVYIVAGSAIRHPALVADYPVMETQFTRRDVSIRFILQEQRRADNHPTAEKNKQGQHITFMPKTQLWFAWIIRLAALAIGYRAATARLPVCQATADPFLTRSLIAALIMAEFLQSHQPVPTYARMRMTCRTMKANSAKVAGMWINSQIFRTPCKYWLRSSYFYR